MGGPREMLQAAPGCSEQQDFGPCGGLRETLTRRSTTLTKVEVTSVRQEMFPTKIHL